MSVTTQEEEIKVKVTLTKEELVEMFEQNICGLSNSKALGDNVEYNFIVYSRGEPAIRPQQISDDVHSIQLVKTTTRQC